MKSEEEIKELYDLIGWFNDGVFMDQKYREGVMNALVFVLHPGSRLETIRNKFRGLTDKQK